MAKTRARPSTRAERPDIFRYEDFRLFLKDWLGYLRAREPEFTFRVLSERTGISTGGLSMIISGARGLSIATLAKLLPELKLKPPEETYFEGLVKLGTLESRDARIKTISKMSRSSSYQKRNPAEARFLNYVGHWYHVAIRELANLPGFKADPEWIQSRLRSKTPLHLVRDALTFLTEQGYLPDPGNPKSGAPLEDTLRCEGQVYWAATTQYHKQMFQLATEAIEETPAQERDIQGFTVPLTEKGVETAREIVKKALDQIEALVNSEDGRKSAVYQVELALFPLTRKE